MSWGRVGAASCAGAASVTGAAGALGRAAAAVLVALCVALGALAGAALFQPAALAFADEGSAAAASATGEAGATDGSDASGSAADPATSGDASDASAADDASDADDANDEGLNNLLDPTQRADNSFIYDTTIESLFDQASLYEGNTVQVVGEVVGDLIRATDGLGEGNRELYWIMLTSTEAEDKSSISVLLTAEQAKQIDHFGRYGVTGTTLQVRGEYHQACAEHQGLSDIHAATSSPIARGIESPDSLNFADFAPGIIAVLLGAALLGVYYFVRERSR